MSNPLTGQFASTAHAMNLGARQLPQPGSGQSGVHTQQQGTTLHTNAGASQQQKSLLPLAQPVAKDTFKAKPASFLSRFVPSFKTLTMSASADALQAQLIKRIYTKPAPMQSPAVHSSRATSASTSATRIQETTRTKRSQTTAFPISIGTILTGAQSFAARTSGQVQSIALRGAAAVTALMISSPALADDVRPYVPTEPTSNFSVDFMNFMARNDHIIDVLIPVGAVGLLAAAFVAGMATTALYFRYQRNREAAKVSTASRNAQINQQRPPVDPTSNQLGSGSPSPTTGSTQPTAQQNVAIGSDSSPQAATTISGSVPATDNPAHSSSSTSAAPQVSAPIASADAIDTPPALAEVRRLIDDKIAQHPSNPHLQQIQGALHAPELVQGLINRDQLPLDRRDDLAQKLNDTLNELQAIMSQMADKDGQGDGGNDSTTESEIVEHLRREITDKLTDPKKQIEHVLTAASDILEVMLNQLTNLKDAQHQPVSEIDSAITNLRLVLSSMRRADAANDLLDFIDTLEVAIEYLDAIVDKKLKTLTDQYKSTITEIIRDLSRCTGLLDSRASNVPTRQQPTLQAQVEVVPTEPSQVSEGVLADEDLQSEFGDAESAHEHEEENLHNVPAKLELEGDGDSQVYEIYKDDARVDLSVALEDEESSTTVPSHAAADDEPIEIEEAPENADSDIVLSFANQSQPEETQLPLSQIPIEARPTEIPLDDDELPGHAALITRPDAVEVPVEDDLLEDLEEGADDILDLANVSAPSGPISETTTAQADNTKPDGIEIKKKGLTDQTLVQDITPTAPSSVEKTQEKNKIRGENHTVMFQGQTALLAGRYGILDLAHPDLGTETSGISHIAGYANDPSKIENEDGILIINTTNLKTGNPIQYQICIDGMGGHKGGAPAMKIIAYSLAKTLNDGLDVESALMHADEDIQAAASLPNEAGAVLVLAALERNAAGLTELSTWVIGDARAVVFRPSANGEIFRTEDQSLVQNLRNNNLIKTDFEQRSHRLSNVVQNPIQKNNNERDEPNYASLNLETNDWVILASDGLWDNFDVSEVYDLIKSCQSADEARQVLFDAALDRMSSGRSGTKSDNLSIIISRVTDSQKSSRPEEHSQPLVSSVIPSQNAPSSEATQVTTPLPESSVNSPEIAPPMLYDATSDPSPARGAASNAISPKHTEQEILDGLEDLSVLAPTVHSLALQDGDSCTSYLNGLPVELRWNAEQNTLINTFSNAPVNSSVILRHKDNPNLILGAYILPRPSSTVSTMDWHPIDSVSLTGKTIILKKPETALQDGTHFRIRIEDTFFEFQFQGGGVHPVGHDTDFPSTGTLNAYTTSTSGDQQIMAIIHDGVIFSPERWYSGDHGDFKANTPEVALVFEQMIEEHRSFTRYLKSSSDFSQKVHHNLTRFTEWVQEIASQFDGLEKDRHSSFHHTQALDELHKVESYLNRYIREHDIPDTHPDFTNAIHLFRDQLRNAIEHVRSFKIDFPPARVSMPDRIACTILNGLPSMDEWSNLTDAYGVRFHFTWLRQNLVQLATAETIYPNDAEAMSNYLMQLIDIKSDLLKRELPITLLSEAQHRLASLNSANSDNLTSNQNEFRKSILGSIYEETLVDIYEFLKSTKSEPLDLDKLATNLGFWIESLKSASPLVKLDDVIYDDLPLIQSLVHDVDDFLHDNVRRTQSLNKLSTVLYVRKNESKIISQQIRPMDMNVRELQKLRDQYFSLKTYARTITNSFGQKIQSTINSRLNWLDGILNSKLDWEITLLDNKSRSFNPHSSISSLNEFLAELQEFRKYHKLTGKPDLNERLEEIIARIESFLKQARSREEQVASSLRPVLENGRNPDLAQKASARALRPRPQQRVIDQSTPAPIERARTVIPDDQPTPPVAPVRRSTPSPDSSVRTPVSGLEPAASRETFHNKLRIERLVGSTELGKVGIPSLAHVNGQDYEIRSTGPAIIFANELLQGFSTATRAEILFTEVYSKLIELLKNPAQNYFLYMGMSVDVKPEDRHLLAIVHLQLFLQSIRVNGLTTEIRHTLQGQNPVLVLIGRSSSPEQIVRYFDLVEDMKAGKAQLRRTELKNLYHDTSMTNRHISVRNTA